MRTEPISIEDFRREEAKHDAEHFPAECRDHFAQIAAKTVHEWKHDSKNGEWWRVEAFPVLCRVWLYGETREDNHDFTNKQITSAASWCLILGGDHASDALADFLTAWLHGGDTLR